MICSKCGKTIPDNATVCPYCLDVKRQGIVKGAATSNLPQSVPQQTAGASKTWVGFILGLILSPIIGIIIGLLLYPFGTEERASFISGWWKALALTIAILIMTLFSVFIL